MVTVVAVTTVSLLLATVLSHEAKPARDPGEVQHSETYFLHRYDVIPDLTEEENAQIADCILRLEYTPTNCQIYMQQLMVKFLPVLYRKLNRFRLKEAITWSLDRYDELMLLCKENCYNITIAYTAESCLANLPIGNFFPDMAVGEFTSMLKDLSTLLCHTNPAGESCLLEESNMITGRVKPADTIKSRCYEIDDQRNATVLPSKCLPQCKLYLERKKEDFGCCISSWQNIARYTRFLSHIVSLWPDKVFEMLKYCEITPPPPCPFIPDMTTISTGLISFLAVAGSVAIIAIIIGVCRSMAEG